MASVVFLRLEIHHSKAFWFKVSIGKPAVILTHLSLYLILASLFLFSTTHFLSLIFCVIYYNVMWGVLFWSCLFSVLHASSAHTSVSSTVWETFLWFYWWYVLPLSWPYSPAIPIIQGVNQITMCLISCIFRPQVFFFKKLIIFLHWLI